MIYDLFGPPTEGYRATKAPEGTPSVEDALDKVRQDRNSRKARVFLAFALYKDARFKEAIDLFEKLSFSNRELEASRLRYLAISRESDGSFEKAAITYRSASRIVETNSEASELMFLAGLNYLRIGNHLDADKLFVDARKADVSNGFALLGQFASAYDQRNWSEAESLLLKGDNFGQVELRSRFDKGRRLLTLAVR